MIEPKTQREKDSYLKGYKEAEKAYGGCHLCYGKGYSTTGTDGVTRVTFCSCDRGQQLAGIWPEHYPKTKRTASPAPAAPPKKKKRV